MKKILIAILIVLILGGGLLYIRGKNSGVKEDGSSFGFRDFFRFGTKKEAPTGEPESEGAGVFTGDTPETPTVDTDETTRGDGQVTRSAFGNNPPITLQTGNTIGIGGIGVGNTIGTGGIPVGGSGGSGGSSGGTGGGSGSGGGGPQCGIDDTEIEFTPEEIARLKALEQRFYTLAPTLRTDEDVQAEAANYSTYKVLNQKLGELILYCENTTPLLPSSINKRVATPLYTDPSQNQSYFSGGADAGLPIDMANPGSRPRETERLFRLNIW